MHCIPWRKLTSWLQQKLFEISFLFFQVVAQENKLPVLAGTPLPNTATSALHEGVPTALTMPKIKRRIKTAPAYARRASETVAISAQPATKLDPLRLLERVETSDGLSKIRDKLARKDNSAADTTGSTSKKAIADYPQYLALDSLEERRIRANNKQRMVEKWKKFHSGSDERCSAMVRKWIEDERYNFVKWYVLSRLNCIEWIWEWKILLLSCKYLFTVYNKLFCFYSYNCAFWACFFHFPFLYLKANYRCVIYVDNIFYELCRFKLLIWWWAIDIIYVMNWDKKHKQTKLMARMLNVRSCVPIMQSTTTPNITKTITIMMVNQPIILIPQQMNES